MADSKRRQSASPATRVPQTSRQREQLLTILCRSETAFLELSSNLRAEHLRRFDKVYSVLWHVVCTMIARDNAMPPDAGFVIVEAAALLERDPGMLDEDEQEALIVLVENIFAAEIDFESTAVIASASSALKQLLDEAITMDYREQFMNPTTGLMAASPAVLANRMSEDLSLVSSLGQSAAVDLFADGWDDEELTSPEPTGLTFIDELLGGGHRDREVYLMMAPFGSCKCLARGTRVLMFDGTIEAVEDIVVGDLLMGPDSRPRLVTSLARGRENLYRVVPAKGDSYTVNESHILSLKQTPANAGDVHKIVNVSVRDYLTKSDYFKKRHLGWRTGVDFPRKSVPLDPYFLGIWLGDGHTVVPRVTTPDSEVVAHMEDFAADRELGLREVGVRSRKHVPHDYKVNDRATRLAILAGLLDAAGSLQSNCYRYISQREGLADDVLFLARSLGLAAYKFDRETSAVKGGPLFHSWYVTISGHTDEIPCRVAHKKAAPRKQKKDVLVAGIELEPLGEGDFFGFEIAGDGEHAHLFVLGDFTVTHNTTIAIQSIWTGTQHVDRMVSENRNRDGKIPLVFYAAYETPPAEIRERLISVAASIPRDRLASVRPRNLRAEGEPLLPYEEIEFERFIAAGVAVRSEQERLRSVIPLTQRYVVILNMTGAAETEGGFSGGKGYVPELAAQINAICRERNGYPHVVWVDHLSAMVDSHCSTGTFDKDGKMDLLKRGPLYLGQSIAKKHRTKVWVLHQLSGEANSRNSAAALHHTDAAGSKSVAEYVDCAFTITVPNQESIAVLSLTKRRRMGPTAPRFVCVEGGFGRVKDATHRYQFDSSRRNIISRFDAEVTGAGDGEEVARRIQNSFGSV